MSIISALVVGCAMLMAQMYVYRNGEIIWQCDPMLIDSVAFRAPMFTITVTANDAQMGSVTGGGEYAYGTEATLTAVANEGYEFVQWQNGQTEASIVVSVFGHESYMAYFKPVSSGNALTIGELTGEFSINSSQLVLFSKGNLQYNAYIGDWRFAENQYDVISGANSNISNIYDGYIDLFGWGTSGYDNKFPYMISTTNSDYGDGTNNISGTNYDWGQNCLISNGGERGDWRTLTASEWTYIFENRPSASNLYSIATVVGMHGVVVLPDAWQLPKGVAFSPRAADYIINTYDAATWTKMEEAGALFLPAAGYRSGTTISAVGEQAIYWSATSASANQASSFYFAAGKMMTSYSAARSYGASVRLVLVKTLCAVTAKVNHPGMGSVLGTGSYTSGESVTITAQPNAGYEFVRWSDGSTTAVRTFVIKQNTDFFAEFRAAGLTKGAIDAKFSVSSNKQVRFSKGNLQYQASTATWRFAENQYDVVGEDNKNISDAYLGWIDLFGWGTSGYTRIMPYEKSIDDKDYAFSSEYKNIAYTNYDWGQYNAISNGGNKAGLWRMLSDSEWHYVLYNRANARELYSQATVNGVTGLILLPDDWVAPIGIFFLPVVNDWTFNTYTSLEWEQMEAAGAVFIPAVGRRYFSSVLSIGVLGFVWSASYYDSSHVCYLFFDSDEVYMGNGSRNYGQSVRLVQDF